MTYKFRVTQYGTSWYHSHFSSQLGDGLYGPIIINGPATANYDIDLGPVFITDWFHSTTFEVWERHAKYGGFPVRTGAVPDNGLINGTNTFPCDDSEDPKCLGTGKRSETTFVPGQKHRIRVIDSQVDGWMRFSIDGHTLTVIAADFVPIVPYTAESIILAPGRRYDVIVEADQPVGNYWMRAIYQTGCNLLNIENNDIKGIIRYEGSRLEDPQTQQWDSIPNDCGDEPASKVVPYVNKDVGKAHEKEQLGISWFYEWDLVFHWTLGGEALTLNWSNPTDLMIYEGTADFPSDYNVFEIPEKDVVRAVYLSSYFSNAETSGRTGSSKTTPSSTLTTLSISTATISTSWLPERDCSLR